MVFLFLNISWTLNSTCDLYSLTCCVSLPLPSSLPCLFPSLHPLPPISPWSQEPLYCSSTEPQSLCTEPFLLELLSPHMACLIPSELSLRLSLKALMNPSTPHSGHFLSISLPRVLVKYKQKNRNHSECLKQGGRDFLQENQCYE